jgi:hypothetical protein
MTNIQAAKKVAEIYSLSELIRDYEHLNLMANYTKSIVIKAAANILRLACHFAGAQGDYYAPNKNDN